MSDLLNILANASMQKSIIASQKTTSKGSVVTIPLICYVYYQHAASFNSLPSFSSQHSIIEAQEIFD